MSVLHHSAICVRNVETSKRFWCDGLGFEPIMDHAFEGDWPTLLRAPSRRLRAVFLGDPSNVDAGIVELVDLGEVEAGPDRSEASATSGFLLLSIMTDLGATLGRLQELGLGGSPRRITVTGIDMAVVVDPDGIHVELVDAAATANLEQIGVDPADPA